MIVCTCADAERSHILDRVGNYFVFIYSLLDLDKLAINFSVTDGCARR